MGYEVLKLRFFNYVLLILPSFARNTEVPQKFLRKECTEKISYFDMGGARVWQPISDTKLHYRAKDIKTEELYRTLDNSLP